MTNTPPTDGNCAEAVLLVLDWIEHRDVRPEAISHAFEILSSHRRRLMLRVVQAHDEELTLADLAEEVAVREFDRDIAAISPETVTEVYTTLYHDHMPRLVDAGLIEYEQERDLVSPVSI